MKGHDLIFENVNMKKLCKETLSDTVVQNDSFPTAAKATTAPG